MTKRTVHDLKRWPVFYEAIDDGRKPFEVRKNDRGYNAGDVLLLREYEPEEPIEAARYTGNESHWLVTYVLSGSDFGVRDGYVVMGIRRLSEREARGL